MSDLKEIKSEPVTEVVEALQDLLQQAESGEIQSFVFAGIKSNASIINAIAGWYKPVTLVGELSVLQRELIDERIDLRSKPAGETYLD